MDAGMSGRKRSFGQVDPLPSGRYRARYRHDGKRHSAPVTFLTASDADLWLASEQVRISQGAWIAPDMRANDTAKALTVAAFVAQDIDSRQLEVRTAEHYASLLQRFIAGSSIGDIALAELTRTDVALWFRNTCPNRPTLRAHAYGLLRSAMRNAVSDGLIPSNPCQVKKGTQTTRVKEIRVASPAEIAAIAKAMNPERLSLMVTMAGWIGLRFGELAELRRADIDLTNRVISIRRAVVRTGSGMVVKRPKSDAGIRPVRIPEFLVPMITEHLRERTGPNGSALLFPAANDATEHLAPSTFYKAFYPARDAAGRPDLRFHDLRHTAGTRFMQNGATIKEAMRLLGHGTPDAAMRYQHAADSRMEELARRMDAAYLSGE